MNVKLTKIGHRPDYFLIAVIFLLTVFGLLMLASASSDLGKIKFNDSYYYIKHQILYGLLVGLAGFFLGTIIHYQRLKRWSFPLLLLSIAALVLVFSHYGFSVKNANRWLQLGPLTFQPAEILKFTYILYLAAWLSNTKMQRIKNLSEGVIPFALISGLIASLLILQPATSTMVILLTSGLVIYFMSGAELKYLFAIVLIGAIALALVIYVTPYRKTRVLSFLNIGQNTENQNYHLNQALIAIGSGGLWGAGYGQSATKATYLPTPIDDSIFAVIAEELGFVGSAALITLLAVLVFRLYWLAKNMRDLFGKLLLIGFGTIVALQSFVHIAANIGLIPLTGVPLPFISYGGTALAVFLTMSGVSINVSKYA